MYDHYYVFIHTYVYLCTHTQALETTLREIEAAIKHFSRPKVYIST